MELNFGDKDFKYVIKILVLSLVYILKLIKGNRDKERKKAIIKNNIN